MRKKGAKVELGSGGKKGDVRGENKRAENLGKKSVAEI